MQMPMMAQSRTWSPTKSWNTSDIRRTARKATSAKMSAPWAAAGMLAAFAGGALLGIFGAKKTMTSSNGETTGWMMTKHHHHELGQPACRNKHGEHEPAAPGARGDQSGRNEGE